MAIHEETTFEIGSWDERPCSQVPGAKLTRASVIKSFQGDLEGTGTLEYVMVYPDDGQTSYIGLEQVEGRLGQRTGNFVLQHDGVIKSDVAKCTRTVVPGSGAGELRDHSSFALVEAER